MTQALIAAGGLRLIVYVPLAVLAWRQPLLVFASVADLDRCLGKSNVLLAFSSPAGPE